MVVFVVENLDVQREGVGQPADMPGDHRHGAELAHCPRGAEHHAVDQAPFDVRQGDVPEHLPAAGAEQPRGFLFGAALFLHQRDQLASDKGHGDEQRCQDDARHGEDDLDIAVGQPLAEVTLGTEQEHVDQAGNHRRYREWQVDQGDQQALAAKLVLAHAPGGGDAEHQIERHRDAHGKQGELERGQGIGLEDRREEGADPLLEGFAEDDQQRQQKEQREGQPGRADQQAAGRLLAATGSGGAGIRRHGQGSGSHAGLLSRGQCGAAAG